MEAPVFPNRLEEARAIIRAIREQRERKQRDEVTFSPQALADYAIKKEVRKWRS